MSISDTDLAEALGALNRVTAERDTARAVAVRLEQEVAALRQYVHLLERNAQAAIGLTMAARGLGADS